MKPEINDVEDSLKIYTRSAKYLHSQEPNDIIDRFENSPLLNNRPDDIADM